MEIVLGIAIAAVVTYLVVGGYLYRQRRGTKTSNDVEASTRPRNLIGQMARALSIVMLWPIVVFQLRTIENVRSIDSSPTKFCRLLSALIGLLLLALLPAGYSSRNPSGGREALPPGTLYEAPEPRWLVSFGRPFPSIPLDVRLGKGIGAFGLRVDVTPGNFVPPAALYWTPELDSHGAPIKGTVFLGMVGGTKNRWTPFQSPTMRASGYWVLHAFDSNTTMYYKAGYAGEEHSE